MDQIDSDDSIALPTIENDDATPQHRRLSWSMTPGMPTAPDVDSLTPESSPKPAEDSTPEESNTQTPTQKPSTWKKKRAVLNDGDRLVLMRLCGEHRPDYRSGNITHFWSLITQLFEADTGKALYIYIYINC